MKPAQGGIDADEIVDEYGFRLREIPVLDRLPQTWTVNEVIKAEHALIENISNLFGFERTICVGTYFKTKARRHDGAKQMYAIVGLNVTEFA